MGSDIGQKYTWDELKKGILLPTGKRHRIIIPSRYLVVRFEIHPAEASSVENEQFTLIGGLTKDAPKYKQTKTGKDDLVKGDAYLDLRFTGLIPDLKYWLEVDPGDDRAKYMAFEEVPWEKIRMW
jgi:hypothetical protein